MGFDEKGRCNLYDGYPEMEYEKSDVERCKEVVVSGRVEGGGMNETQRADPQNNAS